MKIGILAYENCTASMISSLMDILSLANLQRVGEKRPFFEITVITRNGRPVKSFTGHPVASSTPITSKQRYDLIYIPGFLADPIATLRQQRENIAWLHASHKRGMKLCAACNGNLLLAESGLLDGKMATTHWNLRDFFVDRYPNVRLKAEKIIVDEGDVISAGGVTACMNLAIYLIAKYMSVEIAIRCSKIFLVDSGRKVQTPYMVFSTPRSHGDREIVKLQEWIEDHYKEQVSVDVLMNESMMSRRTLVRRFKSATGDTPLEYLQRVRVENAKRFLETTNRTFSEITWDVGYDDISSFQRLFKEHTRLTPREYRTKFAMVGDE